MTHPSIEKARAAIERINKRLPEFERWSEQHRDELADALLQKQRQQPTEPQARSAGKLIYKTNHNALVSQPQQREEDPLLVLADIVGEATGELAARITRLEDKTQ